MSEKVKLKRMSAQKSSKKSGRGKKAFRIALIVLLSLMILAVVICFGAYLLLNHYTGKINYVGNTSDVTMGIGETLEEETEDGTDSPMDVIVSYEDILNQLQSQTATEELPTTDPSKSEQTQAPGDPQQPTAAPPKPVVLPEVAPDKDVLNILLIGIDSRADNNSGRSDAMIVMSINRRTKQIVLTSFLRDMYVAIPGRSNNRLNAAHAYGGASLLLETIKLNFGIQIDYFARVNFFSFVSVVDAAGGVDINVDAKELPYVNSYLKEINRLQGLPIDTSALSEDQVGRIHLNGRQALAYARIRYVGSDYARTERQREVIFAVVDQMKKMSVFELNSFLNAALPQLATNMDQGMINSLVMEIPSLLGYNAIQYRIPADGTAQGMKIDGKSVIAVDLAANRKLLNQVIYGR